MGKVELGLTFLGVLSLSACADARNILNNTPQPLSSPAPGPLEPKTPGIAPSTTPEIIGSPLLATGFGINDADSYQEKKVNAALEKVLAKPLADLRFQFGGNKNLYPKIKVFAQGASSVNGVVFYATLGRRYLTYLTNGQDGTWVALPDNIHLDESNPGNISNIDPGVAVEVQVNLGQSHTVNDDPLKVPLYVPVFRTENGVPMSFFLAENSLGEEYSIAFKNFMTDNNPAILNHIISEGQRNLARQPFKYTLVFTMDENGQYIALINQTDWYMRSNTALVKDGKVIPRPQ